MKALFPRVLLLDASVLQWNRLSEEWLGPAWELGKAADVALTSEPVSVVANAALKKNAHEYHSVGPYWWPDPGKPPEGLPYVWKPGQVNPDRKNRGDYLNLKNVVCSVSTLSLAYWFTRNETYAMHAATLMKVWYLDEKTRMLPHLDFAQEIPGKRKGRGDGIIDTDGQPHLLDAVALLEGSVHWTPEDHSLLQDWSSEFLNWLRTSRNGREENDHVNNHGIQFDVQVATYALFVGKNDIALNIFKALPRRRIYTQIDPDGSQPFELTRDKSWDYACLSTLRFAQVASLALNLGFDLWTYETPDGRGIKKAIDFLIPFANGESPWPYPQSTPFNPRKLIVSLYLAARHFDTDTTQYYANAARHIIHHANITVKKCSPVSWWALPGIASPLAHLKVTGTHLDDLKESGRGCYFTGDKFAYSSSAVIKKVVNNASGPAVLSTFS